MSTIKMVSRMWYSRPHRRIRLPVRSGEEEEGTVPPSLPPPTAPYHTLGPTPPFWVLKTESFNASMQMPCLLGGGGPGPFPAESLAQPGPSLAVWICRLCKQGGGVGMSACSVSVRFFFTKCISPLFSTARRVTEITGLLINEKTESQRSKLFSSWISPPHRGVLTLLVTYDPESHGGPDRV